MTKSKNIVDQFMDVIGHGDTSPIYEKDGNFYFKKNAPKGARQYTGDVDDYLAFSRALQGYVEHNIPLDPTVINKLAGKVSNAFQAQYENFATRHSQISGIGYEDFIKLSKPGGEYHHLGKQFLSEALQSKVNVSDITGIKINNVQTIADLVPGLRTANGPVNEIALKDLRNTVANSFLSPIASATAVAGAKGRDPNNFMSAASVGVLESFFTYKPTWINDKGKAVQNSFISHTLGTGRSQISTDFRNDRDMNMAEKAYLDAEIANTGGVQAGDIPYYSNADDIARFNSGIYYDPQRRSVINRIKRKVAGTPMYQEGDPQGMNTGITAIANILQKAYGKGSYQDVLDTIEREPVFIPGLGHVGGQQLQKDVAVNSPLNSVEQSWQSNVLSNFPKDVEIGLPYHFDPEQQGLKNYFFPLKREGNIHKRVNPNSVQLKITPQQIEQFYNRWDRYMEHFQSQGGGIQNMPAHMVHLREVFDNSLRILDKANRGGDTPLPDVPGNLEQWSVMTGEKGDPVYIGDQFSQKTSWRSRYSNFFNKYNEFKSNPNKNHEDRIYYETTFDNLSENEKIFYQTTSKYSEKDFYRVFDKVINTFPKESPIRQKFIRMHDAINDPERLRGISRVHGSNNIEYYVEDQTRFPEIEGVVEDTAKHRLNAGVSMLKTMHMDKNIELSQEELSMLENRMVTQMDVNLIAARHGLREDILSVNTKHFKGKNALNLAEVNLHEIIYPTAQRAAYYQALEGGLQGGYTNELAVRMLVNGERQLPVSQRRAIAAKHGVLEVHDQMYSLLKDSDIVPPKEGMRDYRVMTREEIAAELDATAPPPPEDPYSVRSGRKAPATQVSGGGGGEIPPENTGTTVADGRGREPYRRRKPISKSSTQRTGMHTRPSVSDVGNQEGENMISGYDFGDLSIPEGSKWFRPYTRYGGFRQDRGVTFVARYQDGELHWVDERETDMNNPSRGDRVFKSGDPNQGYYGTITDPQGNQIFNRNEQKFRRLYRDITGNKFDPFAAGRAAGVTDRSGYQGRRIQSPTGVSTNESGADFSPVTGAINELRDTLISMFSQPNEQQGESWSTSQEEFFDYMAQNPGTDPGDVQQRIAAMHAARVADPNNPFIDMNNLTGEPRNDREREILWKARQGFGSLKDKNRFGDVLLLPHSQKTSGSYRAFNLLQKGENAYRTWRQEVGENSIGEFGNTDREFILSKAEQWTSVKALRRPILNSRGVGTGSYDPLPLDEVRGAINAFDPSTIDDVEKLNDYYEIYKSSLSDPSDLNSTNPMTAAYGYTEGWDNDQRRSAALNIRDQREQEEVNRRNARRSQGVSDRRLQYERYGEGLRDRAMREMSIGNLEGHVGVTGRAKIENDHEGNLVARMVNDNGETIISANEVSQAQGIAMRAVSSATDPNSPMPMNARDAGATVKKRISDAVNAEIKSLEDGFKKNGFTDTEIKAKSNRIKSTVETFTDKAANSIMKGLGEIWDDKDFNSYKDRSFAQHKNIPVNANNLEQVLKENPRLAALAFESTGIPASELVSNGISTLVTDPEVGTAYDFGGEGYGVGTRQQQKRGYFGQGNTRSLLYGAMMMRYSWMMAAEPTLRQVQEYGEGMQPIGAAAGIGSPDYNAIGGASGFKARQSLYKQYMGQGAYEVYGGFSETPGLIGGGKSWYPRMAAYAGPALGVAMGGLALGGSMGMFGAQAGMAGMSALGSILPIAGATIGGTMLTVGAGMELYNANHPDKDPVSIGSVYRSALQDLSFARTYADYDQARMDEIIANSDFSFTNQTGVDPVEAAKLSGGSPWAYGMSKAMNMQLTNAQLGRQAWADDPEFRRQTILNDPLTAAALSSSGLTEEEKKIQKYGQTLGTLSGEGEEGGRNGVLALYGTVGASNVEKFFTPENFEVIGNLAKTIGMSSEEIIKASGEYAGSFGVRRGTEGFTNYMLDFLNQNPDITDMERLLDRASKRTQYGGQLQYMMGHGEQFTGLGEKLFNQYQPTSQEMQYAQQVAASIQRYGEMSPSSWSTMMNVATNSNAMQIGAISSVISAPGMGDLIGAGSDTPNILARLAGQLSDAGMSEQQSFIVDRAAAGDLKATSWYGHFTGDSSFTQYYDKYGYFAGRRDGNVAYNLFNKFMNDPGQGFADWRQMYGADFANIDTSDPTKFAASITGSDDPEIQQAFLKQGLFGIQLLQQKKSAENSLASAGLAMQGVTLQREYLWGSGTWDNPAEGSMYYLEDRMRALQHSSQMESFDDQWRRLQLNNQYATQSERLQENRMYTSHAFNNWQQSFNYNMQLTQRDWTQQDWGYQDQMRALNQGWQMEDLDEAIRFSSGRERRKLVRQKERMAVSTNLEDEQIGEQRERQEELWAAEDERYQKNMDYQKQMQDMDVQNFELGKQQRQEFFQLDQESFERRKADYLEQKELQDEMMEKQREHQAKQLELQAASAGLQAKAAEEQLKYTEALMNAEQPIDNMEKSIQNMNEYDLAFRNMEMIQATIGIINKMAIEKVTATGQLFSQIDAMNVQKLRSLRDMLLSLISIGE